MDLHLLECGSGGEKTSNQRTGLHFWFRRGGGLVTPLFHDAPHVQCEKTKSCVALSIALDTFLSRIDWKSLD